MQVCVSYLKSASFEEEQVIQKMLHFVCIVTRRSLAFVQNCLNRFSPFIVLLIRSRQQEMLTLNPVTDLVRKTSVNSVTKDHDTYKKIGASLRKIARRLERSSLFA